MLFRIELVWRDKDGTTSPSIYLVADGSVIIQGTDVPQREREKMLLPNKGGLLRVNREIIKAIKEML